ncbi:fibroblast growth factor 1-like [Actinia tenebrosa]|uniref:Fibroblast growth factor n=1 Tax=Actinia tenebrosa TaxID=6105 RepID=A0A6P8HKY2_ACTTE|nr:fibroblast growth factor 1-like [Actinia tenebrosa]
MISLPTSVDLFGKMASITPNPSRRTILICSNGFYLRVNDDAIDGVTDIQDENIVLEMHSVAIGEIVLFGEKSMKYIAMDNDGNLITTSSLVHTCVFKEKHLTTGYNTYESKANAGWYLGLTIKGTPKRGPKTSPGQNAVSFLTGDAP